MNEQTNKQMDESGFKPRTQSRNQGTCWSQRGRWVQKAGDRVLIPYPGLRFSLVPSGAGDRLL